jgi:hypothetical protein
VFIIRIHFIRAFGEFRMFLNSSRLIGFILSAIQMAIPNSLNAKEKEPSKFELKLKSAIVEKDDSEVRKLQKERYNTALELVDLLLRRLESGMGSISGVSTAFDRVITSGLDLYPSGPVRVIILEEAVRYTKHVEENVKVQFEAGVVGQSDVAVAHYTRLTAEIRLLREKEKQKENGKK